MIKVEVLIVITIALLYCGFAVAAPSTGGPASGGTGDAMNPSASSGGWANFGSASNWGSNTVPNENTAASVVGSSSTLNTYLDGNAYHLYSLTLGNYNGGIGGYVQFALATKLNITENFLNAGNSKFSFDSPSGASSALVAPDYADYANKLRLLGDIPYNQLTVHGNMSVRGEFRYSLAGLVQSDNDIQFEAGANLNVVPNNQFDPSFPVSYMLTPGKVNMVDSFFTLSIYEFRTSTMSHKTTNSDLNKSKLTVFGDVGLDASNFNIKDSSVNLDGKFNLLTNSKMTISGTNINGSMSVSGFSNVTMTSSNTNFTNLSLNTGKNFINVDNSTVKIDGQLLVNALKTTTNSDMTISKSGSFVTGQRAHFVSSQLKVDGTMDVTGKVDAEGSHVSIGNSMSLAGGQVNLINSSLAFNSGSQLVSNGTINMGSSQLSFGTGSNLAPNGGSITLDNSTVSLKSASTLSPTGGAIHLFDSKMSMESDSKLAPAGGSINLSNSSLSLQNGANLAPAGGSINLNNSSMSLQSGSILAPAGGKIDLVESSLSLDAGSKLTSHVTATITLTNTQFVNSGSFSGSLTVDSDSAINNKGSFVFSGPIVPPSNNLLSRRHKLHDSAPVHPTFTNAGTASINATNLINIAMEILNAGTMNVLSNATVPSFSQSKGSTTLAGGSLNSTGEILIGGGSLNGVGTLSSTTITKANLGSEQINTLKIDGNLTIGDNTTQTTLKINSNTTYSTINVTGTVTLDGNLTILVTQEILDATKDGNVTINVVSFTDNNNSSKFKGISIKTFNPNGAHKETPSCRVSASQSTGGIAVLVQPEDSTCKSSNPDPSGSGSDAGPLANGSSSSSFSGWKVITVIVVGSVIVAAGVITAFVMLRPRIARQIAYRRESKRNNEHELKMRI
ncbi:hypothetical protein SAMD00019534_062870 [Acytostelium subglobosum LB1]|uniref:hypothetical protein n=1 Tax=Acytostelium subglobosum LB1 TaxID=1410327 RepID=UPI0006450D62|nr:hypothetical protein SAMD00019534_062870 [Acytostelium subglobosum LB1]GAM23112.1 hypothetical protein SAMD00019534_062870 [Acytostelium subglobosum LB1]|eukprot:XP_012754339.1 hypothetical protein SAMD00019534_062870 [Acytostelium subglobosum LB1]